MPRYVILEHDHPAVHWDFMLEAGSALQTWRLSATPHPGQSIPATFLFDHRLLYLDYEGPVSGDRGRVVRWDRGTFTWLARAEGRVEVQLHGGRLQGTAVLQQIHAQEWSMTFNGS
jgi:hypothetical protein